jgi:hypothetical protein
MAQQNSVDINVNVQGNAVESIGNVKKALKEANAELINAQANFGDYSKEAIEAAKKVAGLKDRISEARETADLFDPGKKFQALAGAATAVAGGFTAVQGALGLLGVESESVEKTLLKVQSALALSQGLSTITDAAKDFQRLGTVASSAFDAVKTGAAGAFKTIRSGIAATGIGVLVLALGAIVAYWDDIKELVNGVSSEQEKLNASTKENLKAQEDKLSAIDGQSNQLRLQGKSEKDILNLKIKQSAEAIKAAEINLQNAKNTKNAQVEAAKRNFEFTKGLLNFLSLPVTAVLAAADALGTALGKNFGLLDKFTGGIAKLVFDPAQVAKDGDATIKEAESTLNKLKEGRAASQLALQNIDKQGSKNSSQNAEKLKKEREEREEEEKKALLKLSESRNQIFLSTFKDENDKKRAELNLAFIKEKDEILANTKITEATRNELILAARTKLNNDLDAIAAAEKQKKDAADAKMLEDAAAQMAKEDDLEFANLQKKFSKTQEDEKKQAAKDLADLDKKIAKNTTDLELERSLLDEKQIAVEEAFANSLITEEQYNAALEANAKARADIDKLEAEAKVKNAEVASQLLGTISDIVGKNTAAGKAAAIASATIDTYLSAQKAYASQLLPGDPTSPIRAAIAAGIAVVGGIKNVKSILAVKTPNGGGGGAANISAPSLSGAPIAPPQPQAATTNISAQSINALGNQATRAYVVESDVTSSQERIAAIQQRARFG